MATTIITPPAAPQDSNNGMGFLLGIIILVVFISLIILYAWPYFKDLTSEGLQINLPNKIDVNVEQPN